MNLQILLQTTSVDFNHKKQPLTHPIPSNLERPVLYNTANFIVQLDSNNINQRHGINTYFHFIIGNQNFQLWKIMLIRNIIY